MTRIVLYLNQFFGQIGGEDVAGVPPRFTSEIVGPGRALAGLLAEDEELAGTVICGDNYFSDQPEKAAAECLAHVRLAQPDIFLAGPAFNAGRYGVACGALCKYVQAELGIPPATAMFEENPGVDLFHGDVLILRTGQSAAAMREVLSSMLRMARKLRAGEPLGKPRDEGYFPRGYLVGELAVKPAAERAVDMLLAKMAAQPFETEVPLPTFDPPQAPEPLKDAAQAKVALVTDGGLVPAGNPDGIEVSAATKFAAYSLAGLERLDPAKYDVSHGGYDNRYVKQDPHRLVPLDVARELEREGRIGTIYEQFLSTTGLANPVNNSRRLGRGMAEHLKEAGVDAVILTST
jgi:glycine reductase complex component B subunit gamma